MPYIYEVSFELEPQALDELAVGRSLERVLGYLRTLLPNEHGYMTSRVLRSLDDTGCDRLVVLSEWGSWDALVQHRSSCLLENKVLSEFAPHITPERMRTQVYVEVGPEPY